jgi:hypothetical protein
MDSEVKDMKGNAIFVGCKVSDGLVAGTVTAVYPDQVWLSVGGSIGKKVRGVFFNKPENLLLISPESWKRQMGAD